MLCSKASMQIFTITLSSSMASLENLTFLESLSLARSAMFSAWSPIRSISLTTWKYEAIVVLCSSPISELDSLTRYLVKLSNSDIGDEQRTTIASYFHVVNDIERIGDHAENIADLAKDKLSKNVKFSKDAIEELKVMVNICIEALEHSIECFSDYSDKKALDVRTLEEKIDTLEKDLKISHIKRLNNGSCDAIVGTIFLDLISNLERVGDHAVNIAEILS